MKLYYSIILTGFFMKTKMLTYPIYFCSFLFLIIISPKLIYSQNCDKKKLATNEMKGNLDYRGQSMFVGVNSGDSTVLNVVLYSKQNYRIFVVGEQKLGKISYKIYVPRKKFTRVVKEIQPKKITIYKKDPLGFYLYDVNGIRIPIGEETIQDTIWARETSSIDDLVFNSASSDVPYWLATPNKTQLITIKINVEPNPRKIDGCIGVYVGREYSNAYQFRR
jgi:hypothetical protein